LNNVKIIKKKDIVTFEDITHIDLNGYEYGNACELPIHLESHKRNKKEDKNGSICKVKSFALF